MRAVHRRAPANATNASSAGGSHGGGWGCIGGAGSAGIDARPLAFIPVAFSCVAAGRWLGRQDPAPGGAAGGRPAHRPASPRPPARRGCTTTRIVKWPFVSISMSWPVRSTACCGVRMELCVGFTANRATMGCPGGNPTEDASGMIGGEVHYAVLHLASHRARFFRLIRAAAVNPSPISTPSPR